MFKKKRERERDYYLQLLIHITIKPIVDINVMQ